MNYEIRWTSSFKRDYKVIQKRGMNINLLDAVIRKLAVGETLPVENHDHPLIGDWAGFHECHIRPDWLLVYRYYEDVLVLSLVHTGTHNDLFGK